MGGKVTTTRFVSHDVTVFQMLVDMCLFTGDNHQRRDVPLLSVSMCQYVYSNCVLLVSPMSLLSCLPAGPSSHAALSARRTQQEAHELRGQRL